MTESLMIIGSAAFVLGISSSVHCAAMCGGIAAYCSKRGHGVAHLAYQSSRGIAYLLLGAVAGALGQLTSISKFLGSGIGVSFFALLMIAWAIREWLRLGAESRASAVDQQKKEAAGPEQVTLISPSQLRMGAKSSRTRFRLSRVSEWLGKRYGRLASRTREQSPLLRGVSMGFLTPLLPCGLLYMAVASAASTANPIKGMLMMAAFFLGTCPALLLIGALGQWFNHSLSRVAPRLAAVTMLLLGVYTLGERVQWSWPNSDTNDSDGASHCPHHPGK